jgi:hypothetical protein
MTQKIKTTDVLNKDSVGDVHQETGWERILSKFPFVIENAVATFLVAAALVISIVILFSGKDSKRLQNRGVVVNFKCSWGCS